MERERSSEKNQPIGRVAERIRSERGLHTKNEAGSIEPSIGEYAVLRQDRDLKGEARRGDLAIILKKKIPYAVVQPKVKKRGLDHQIVKIPLKESDTFTIHNLYLPPENSPYLRRIGYTEGDLPITKESNEIWCVNLNAHSSLWDEHAQPNERGSDIGKKI